MRRKLPLIILIGFLFSGVWQFARHASAQQSPLTLAQVLTGLQTQGRTAETNTLAKRNVYIAKRVRQVGVTFRLTSDIENELRNAGATDELIEAIRENSPPVPTPTPERVVTGGFEGRVIDSESGAGISGVYVRFISSDGSTSAQRTDANGNFQINSLSPAVYTIKIEVDGYEVFETKQNLYATQMNRVLPSPIALKKNTSVAGDAPTSTTTSVSSSDNATFYVNRGKEYLEQNRADDAIAAFTRALEIDSNNVEAYYFRGRVYSYKKTGEESRRRAIEDFTQTIRLGRLFDGYFQRGLIYYYDFKDYDRAITDFSEAIKAAPNIPTIYKVRGECYEKRGYYDAAIADFKKTLELDPNNADAKAGLERISRRRQ